jgi:hypothetical protein
VAKRDRIERAKLELTGDTSATSERLNRERNERLDAARIADNERSAAFAERREAPRRAAAAAAADAERRRLEEVSIDEAVATGPQQDQPPLDRSNDPNSLMLVPGETLRDRARNRREGFIEAEALQRGPLPPEAEAAPAAAEAAPAAAADPEPDTPRERRSFLGRDLATGNLVGRETFMGQPLTPQLQRIPANLRRRVEDRSATTAERGFEGVPTPEKVAAVQAEMQQKLAAARTEEEKQEFAVEQAKMKDEIQAATLRSAGTVMDMARRGDPLAAQFAPLLMEEMAELREVEMQLAQMDPADGVGRTELTETRDEVIESIQGIVGQGAMPSLIERSANAPTEQEVAAR